MSESPVNAAPAMRTDMPGRDAMLQGLSRAVDFLLRWQIGVNTYVEDFWSESTGWIKRPCPSWMAGGFPGDWFRHGPHDHDGGVWRMGMGPTWHTGQALRALIRAARWCDSPPLRRGIAEGSRFLSRLQLIDGPHAGALWTPPHSLPPQWREQTNDAPIYFSPAVYKPARDRLVNSDMCEAVGGLLEAAQFLNDPIALEAARRWGQWQYREGDIPPGDDQYHQIDLGTGIKGHVRDFGGQNKQPYRVWTIDDGVQGLLGLAFDEPDWIERYLMKVEKFLAHGLDLRAMPRQQGRTFYWDTSILHPILQRRIDGPFDRALALMTEYAACALKLRGSDGLFAMGFDTDGKPNFDSGFSSGDGAATVMTARMCRILFEATGDERWRTQAAPMLHWALDNQWPADAPDRMAGGMPFCNGLLDKDGRRFDFTRSIATTFTVMAISEWLDD